MKSKIYMLPSIVLLFTFLSIPLNVFAHVILNPEERSISAWEKYAVRVPVEKEIHTTEVEL